MLGGYDDDSARSATYLRKLGLARAKAATRVVTYGATSPRATNDTAAGRARNRRVVLTIVR